MFPAEKPGEWEPHRVRKRQKTAHPIQTTNETSKVDFNEQAAPELNGEKKDEEYEEDPLSDEGAVWPIQAGRIVDWPCFLALMNHVANLLGAAFHMPILLIAQPIWTPHEHEKITQFFFEKFKPPAFAFMDAAQATCYAFAVGTATVIDIGTDKADVTAVCDFIIQDGGRTCALPDCGGEAMTQRLLELSTSKGFNRDMCEQLKHSSVCEILPSGAALPGSKATNGEPINPASSASTGADGPGPNQRHTAGALGEAPRGPGVDTEVGQEERLEEDNDGVVDVASIIASGKTNDFLAKKEKEKAERQAARRKGADAAAAAQAKQIKLRNSEREINTFPYEDHALRDALKNEPAKPAPGIAAIQDATDGIPNATDVPPIEPSPTNRRDIQVDTIRFQALSDTQRTQITSAIHRTILAVPHPTLRATLWNSLIITGNGARVRGFREAILETLTSRFLISPSNTGLFTSELPSVFSTPTGTGTSTPLQSLPVALPAKSMLQTATAAAAAQHLQPPLGTPAHAPQQQQQTPYSRPLPQFNPNPAPQSQSQGHPPSQTPAHLGTVRLPEYFSEWRDPLAECDAAFLGAQVAAKVIFLVDPAAGSGAPGKGFMGRTDYNEQGPSGISEFRL